MLSRQISRRRSRRDRLQLAVLVPAACQALVGWRDRIISRRPADLDDLRVFVVISMSASTGVQQARSILVEPATRTMQMRRRRWLPGPGACRELGCGLRLARRVRGWWRPGDSTGRLLIVAWIISVTVGTGSVAARGQPTPEFRFEVAQGRKNRVGSALPSPHSEAFCMRGPAAGWWRCASLPLPAAILSRSRSICVHRFGTGRTCRTTVDAEAQVEPGKLDQVVGLVHHDHPAEPCRSRASAGARSDRRVNSRAG